LPDSAQVPASRVYRLQQMLAEAGLRRRWLDQWVADDRRQWQGAVSLARRARARRRDFYRCRALELARGHQALVLEPLDLLQRGTAIGSGILVSLTALFPDAGIDISRAMGEALPVAHKGTEQAQLTPVRPGSYESAAILLLTDGQNTVGPDPMEAAQIAADRGVKVFTVGFGTKEGEIIDFEGWSMRVLLDEDTLMKIANLTEGAYFHAGSGADLKRVYEGLKSRLVLEQREVEVTALFADAAALFTLIAVVLSVWWFGKVA
jgi:hypothetical protein